MGVNLNLKWEDAPSTTRGRGAEPDPEERAAAEQLKQNPGKQARVFEVTLNPDSPSGRQKAAAIAQSINRGERRSFGPGFKAVSRTLDEGRLGVVWVTYVGEQSAAN